MLWALLCRGPEFNRWEYINARFSEPWTLRQAARRASTRPALNAADAPREAAVPSVKIQPLPRHHYEIGGGLNTTPGPERYLQGNQSENRARLSWIYRVDPRIRAAAIFGAIVAIAAVIARIDGELAGPDVLLAAYAGMFVVYILFRFGYFAERVLLKFHGSSQFTVQKLRSTQGGRRFNPTEPESFISAVEANEELRGEDRVAGIEVNGDAVALPMSAMALREVINMEIGSERVSVSWWAISYAARAFVRRLPSGHTVTFEPMPKTVLNSTVFSDESPDGRWVQFVGQAIAGENTGHTLKQLPVIATNWSAWSSAYPDTEVLSTDGTPEWDIFERYYFNDRPGLHRQSAKDRRLPDKEIVMGVVGRDTTKAYPYRSLIEEPLIHEEIDREPILVLLERISATAAVFSRIVEGRVLTFDAESENPRRPELIESADIVPEPADDSDGDDKPDDDDEQSPAEGDSDGPEINYEPLMLRDRETGSVWRALNGYCVEGELEGKRMRMLEGQTGFWFVWSRFYPNTELLPLPNQTGS